MELLNFDFWQAFYSVIIGAVEMFIISVSSVFFQELKRLHMLNRAWLIRPLIVLPLCVLIILLADWASGMHTDMFWLLVGALPIGLATDRKVILSKMQPFFMWRRKQLYEKIVSDEGMMCVLVEADSLKKLQFVLQNGMLVEIGEYLYKDAQGFGEDLQKFLDRQEKLQLPQWKIDVLKEYGYRLSDKIIPEPE